MPSAEIDKNQMFRLADSTKTLAIELGHWQMASKLRRGAVQVRGRNMTCTSYHSGCVTIGGWIEGISFSETEGAV